MSETFCTNLFIFVLIFQASYAGLHNVKLKYFIMVPSFLTKKCEGLLRMCISGKVSTLLARADGFMCTNMSVDRALRLSQLRSHLIKRVARING